MTLNSLFKIRQLILCLGLGLLTLLLSSLLKAEKLESVLVEGNRKVESEAILNLLSSKSGEDFSKAKISKDIHVLYELGYFSDIRFFAERDESKKDSLTLKVQVKEKPAIISIDFEGLTEFKPEDFKDLLETKLYMIINEGKIASDVRKIENKYSEKGFYLASVSYTVQEKGDNEVALVFQVRESGKVLVGDVHILGNQFFTDDDLFDKLATRPYTRSSAISSASLFQMEAVNRDVEFLSYYYRDYGFADVKLAKPLTQIDSDQNFVRVTFSLEEGIQYKVASIKVSGDVGGEEVYQEADLIQKMLLKPQELFRYSRFAKDIEMIVDKYGDLGYAYVDVNPVTHFDPEKKTVDLDYVITKGQKVYFSHIVIVGNTKTRDNVIRREFEMSDSELYSGTKLTKSKENVSRLGFFEEVQVLKERDEEKEDLLDLKFKMKEKSTGQMRASFGYSPGGERRQAWFGEGRYDEKNQSGRAWEASLSAKWANSKDYELGLGFADPRLNDGPWSLGTNISFRKFYRRYSLDIEVPELHRSVAVSLGRKLFELVQGSLTLRHTQIRQLEDIYIFEDYQEGGVKNSLITSLQRRDVDNYLDPSKGSSIILSHEFTGGLGLGGNYQFMESSIDVSQYVPLDFSDTFRTYFKLRGVLGKLWPVEGVPIPPSERYRLGGYGDLRGFGFQALGPKQRRTRSPQNNSYDYNLGGDKQLYFQLEYFIPLIPKAGIKSLLFVDAGQSFLESESLSLGNLRKDAGFGFRWLTPVAPFRFEWAYPYRESTQSFGDVEFIFTLGY